MQKVIAYFAAILVLFVALLVVLNVTYTRNLDISAEFSGRHVEFDGFTLRIAESGAGEAAVQLVPGSLGSLEDWESVVPLLDKKYRVIAIDRLGHGYSADSPTPNSVALDARATWVDHHVGPEKRSGGWPFLRGCGGIEVSDG